MLHWYGDAESLEGVEGFFRKFDSFRMYIDTDEANAAFTIGIAEGEIIQQTEEMEA